MSILQWLLICLAISWTIVGVIKLVAMIRKEKRLQREVAAEVKRQAEASAKRKAWEDRWNTEIIDHRWVNQKLRDRPLKDQFSWEKALAVYARKEILAGETRLYDEHIMGNVMLYDDGSLHFEFTNDKYMEPSIKEAYLKLFYERFPDWDEPNPERLERFYIRQAEEKAAFEKDFQRYCEREQARQDSIPKCPHCHSKNIQKIGFGKRVVSTELFGLASPTIGKTMECKSCGYKW